MPRMLTGPLALASSLTARTVACWSVECRPFPLRSHSTPPLLSFSEASGSRHYEALNPAFRVRNWLFLALDEAPVNASSLYEALCGLASTLLVVLCRG